MTMQIFKYLCLLTGLIGIAAAITGIQSVHSTSAGTTIATFSNADRIYSLALGIISAALFYGIHKRVLITWKLGFPVVIFCYLTAAIRAILSMLRTTRVFDFPSFWLPIGISEIVNAGVMIWLLFWWKGQKNYFVNQ